MKIQDRSEELCRENDRLYNQVEVMTKELEMERGKLKIKIRELMDERERAKRLDTQLIGACLFSDLSLVLVECVFCNRIMFNLVLYHNFHRPLSSILNHFSWLLTPIFNLTF